VYCASKNLVKIYIRIKCELVLYPAWGRLGAHIVVDFNYKI